MASADALIYSANSSNRMKPFILVTVASSHLWLSPRVNYDLRNGFLPENVGELKKVLDAFLIKIFPFLYF